MLALTVVAVLAQFGVQTTAIIAVLGAAGLAVGLFATELTTFDGVFVSVPNAQLWNRSIHNCSRNPTRRLDLTVGISYSDHVERAIGVLENLVASDPRVLDEPAAQVMIKVLSVSSVDINLILSIIKNDR